MSPQAIYEISPRGDGDPGEIRRGRLGLKPFLLSRSFNVGRWRGPDWNRLTWLRGNLAPEEDVDSRPSFNRLGVLMRPQADFTDPNSKAHTITRGAAAAIRPSVNWKRQPGVALTSLLPVPTNGGGRRCSSAAVVSRCSFSLSLRFCQRARPLRRPYRRSTTFQAATTALA